jgi:hypothetical protein
LHRVEQLGWVFFNSLFGGSRVGQLAVGISHASFCDSPTESTEEWCVAARDGCDRGVWHGSIIQGEANIAGNRLELDKRILLSHDGINRASPLVLICNCISFINRSAESENAFASCRVDVKNKGNITGEQGIRSVSASTPNFGKSYRADLGAWCTRDEFQAVSFNSQLQQFVTRVKVSRCWPGASGRNPNSILRNWKTLGWDTRRSRGGLSTAPSS